jgi:hypothetical protein
MLLSFHNQEKNTIEDIFFEWKCSASEVNVSACRIDPTPSTHLSW